MAEETHTEPSPTPAPGAAKEDLPMEIHKPKPVHNWREFFKEYAIIVLGVLTALAGEELVVTIHHHSEVADLRTALHRELAWDLLTMKDTADDLPCVEQRVKEMEDWKASLQSAGLGQPKIIIPIPIYSIFRTSTWRSAAGTALDNFPLDERVAYAQFYDGVDNNARYRDGIMTAWHDLDGFKDAHGLSAAEVRQVSHDIDQIRDGYRRIASNYNGNWKANYAPALNLRTDDAPPQDEAQRVGVAAARATLCQPITAK